MKKNLFLIVLSLYGMQSFAQNQHAIDSLTNQLKNHEERKKSLQLKSLTLFDTTASDILGLIAAQYWGNNPEKSLEYANQMMKLSNAIDYKKGIANANGIIGVNYKNKGSYQEALEFHKKALAIREEIGHQKGIISSYTNIGNIYAFLGKHSDAIKYYLGGLKIAEEIGEKNSIANFYNNIGGLYANQEDFTEALKNLFKALPLREQLNNKVELGNIYDNIGSIYLNMNNYSEALKYIEQGLQIRLEIQDKSGITTSNAHLGSLYQKQGEYEKALHYLQDGLKLQEAIGNKRLLSNLYGNIGLVYAKNKNYADATIYLNKALARAKEIGDLSLMTNIYSNLVFLDSMQGQFKESLENYKLMVITRDSFESKEKVKKTLELQMQYEFDKKEVVTKRNFQYQKDSLKMASEKQQLELEKQLQLKTLRSEYARKQALAKSEEEKKELQFEEELKRSQLNFDFKQKEIALQTEQERKDLVAKATQQNKDAFLKLEKQQNEIKQKQQQTSMLIAFGILSLVGIFLFYSFKQKQIAKRNQEMIAMKQRISRDLHDDIGSTLSTISKYAELANKKIDPEHQVSGMLETVNLISKEMLSRMSDIVWSLNPKNDTMQQLLNRLQNFCASSLSTNDITHHFVINDQIETLPLSSVQLKEIYLIGKEAIYNSLKYSKCKDVQLTFSKRNQHLLMEIKDDGIGFNPEKLSNPMGGFGLHNMKERASEILASLEVISSANAGCSIQLLVPLS